MRPPIRNCAYPHLRVSLFTVSMHREAIFSCIPWPPPPGQAENRAAGQQLLPEKFVSPRSTHGPALGAVNRRLEGGKTAAAAPWSKALLASPVLLTKKSSWFFFSCEPRLRRRTRPRFRKTRHKYVRLSVKVRKKKVCLDHPQSVKCIK